MRYKPSKLPFLYFWFAKLFLATVFSTAVIVTLIYVVWPENALVVNTLILSFIIVFILYSAINRFFQYSKEEYVFLNDRIVKKTGGVFSDKSVELLVKKITNVKRTLPFVETSVFGTGTISIESAGSGGTEVFMVSLEQTKEIYDEVEKLMKNNGFVINKEKVVQQEIPSKIGSFFELGPGIFSFVLFLYFAMIPLLRQIGSGEFFGFETAFMPYLTLGGLFVVFAYGLTVGVIRFIDLIKRTYTMYDDCITYEEGFLTKVYSLIPIENLADSEVSQNILFRALGIYDIVVSCQGSGSQILFKSMYNGDSFERNLDSLIKNTESLATKVEEEGKVSFEKKVKKERSSMVERDFTVNDLGIKFSRYAFTLFVLLPISFVLLPLFPFVLFFLISRAIEVGATKYYLNKDTVEMNYEFLRKQNIEFSNDKITGIVVRENFVDRWFNTVSITFWSIGSDKDIVFKYVSKENDLVHNILRSEGYFDEEKKRSFKPKFDFHNFVTGNPVATLVLGLGVGASLLASFLITALYLIFTVALLLLVLVLGVWRYKYHEKAEFDFYNSYLYHKRGFLFQTSYYVDYKDVKDVNSKKYWYLSKGTVTVGVAGESALDQQATNFLPYGFSVKYVPNIFGSDKDINDLIGLYNVDEKTVKVSKPDYRNSIVTAFLVSSLFVLGSFFATVAEGVTFVLPVFAVVLSFVLIVWIVWSVKVTRYEVSNKGLYRFKGILYRQKKTVLYEKIDHLNKKTGMINKLFGNGSVYVYNTGSSLVEMRVSNIPDFEEFFTLVQKHYN